MVGKVVVIVETSDNSRIRLNLGLNPNLLDNLSQEVREAIRIVLFSEIWKKAAIHGWKNYYNIEISVKYDELQIEYEFSIFAESAMTVKSDVTRETYYILPKIKRIIAYKIKEKQNQN